MSFMWRQSESTYELVQLKSGTISSKQEILKIGFFLFQFLIKKIEDLCSGCFLYPGKLRAQNYK